PTPANVWEKACRRSAISRGTYIVQCNRDLAPQAVRAGLAIARVCALRGRGNFLYSSSTAGCALSTTSASSYRRASSSLSRISNKAILLLIGSAVVMSTPASRDVSSGNFDPPDLRKPRYFSTAPGSPWRTRSERVTAADSPVAYL